MTDLETRLRADAAVAAPEPSPKWLDDLADLARQHTAPAVRRPRRWLRLALVLGLAAMLGVGVLAVAVRRPESPPSPVSTLPAARTAEPGSLADVVLHAGVPATPSDESVGALGDLRYQVVPGSIRAIRSADIEATAVVLRNGAVCLLHQADVDCALPSDHREVLFASYAGNGCPCPGYVPPVVFLATPRVAKVEFVDGANIHRVALRDGVGTAGRDHASGGVRITLVDGSTTFPDGSPFDPVTGRSFFGRANQARTSASPRPPAPAPDGPGRADLYSVFATAGTPSSVRVYGVSGDRQRPRDTRLLASGLGLEAASVYAYTTVDRARTRWLCFAVGNGGEPPITGNCSHLTELHALSFAGDGGFPDYVAGLVAPSVRNAWVSFADGSRVEATVAGGVVRAEIPPERTARDPRLMLRLDDGSIVEP